MDGRTVLTLFLAVWVVYLATVSYSGAQANDARAAATSAWSLGTRGTLALPQQWAGTVDWEAEGVDGQLYTNRFPGPILVAAPFYTVAGWLGFADEPEHPHFLNYAPAGVAAATVAALAVAVLYAVFRRLADRRLAVWAAVAFAFGTASWSVSADALWTHAVTSLGLALGLLGMATDRHARAGLGYALSVVARPQTAVIPAVVGIWRGIARRHAGPVVAVGLTSAIGVVALSVYTRLLFGSWIPVAGYDPVHVTMVTSGSAAGLPTQLLYALANDERGMLLYTPVLLVLLPFVWRGWRIAPDWVRSSSIAGIVYLVVQLRTNVWHGGLHYFGSRLTVEVLVVSSPLLLRTWQAVADRDRIFRLIVTAAVVVSFVIHAFGATVASTSPEGRAIWERRLDTACELAPEAEVCVARRSQAVGSG